MGSKKILRVWFREFWSRFDYNNNVFVWILSHNYDVVVTSDNPDILISGDSGTPYQNAKIVYFSSELYLPADNHTKYILSSFHINREGHFRVPLILLYAYDYFRFGITKSYESVFDKSPPKDILNNKSQFCTYISRGSGRSDCIRDGFYHELTKYKPVMAAGSHLNNHPKVGGEPGTIQGSISKHEFLKDFKFTMSFEGGSGIRGDYGWITEKIYEPMMAYSIPIYWGNIRIGEDFNNNSFINWHDYGNDEDCIKRIIEVDNNDSLYMDYINSNYVSDKTNSVFTTDYLIDIFEQIIND
tara:strand:+ start:3648 stop:4544 length:897 start_codon:yes stop_codon:yes gene_type:complete